MFSTIGTIINIGKNKSVLLDFYRRDIDIYESFKEYVIKNAFIRTFACPEKETLLITSLDQRYADSIEDYELYLEAALVDKDESEIKSAFTFLPSDILRIHSRLLGYQDEEEIVEAITTKEDKASNAIADIDSIFSFSVRRGDELIFNRNFSTEF